MHFTDEHSFDVDNCSISEYFFIVSSINYSPKSTVKRNPDLFIKIAHFFRANSIKFFVSSKLWMYPMSKQLVVSIFALFCVKNSGSDSKKGDRDYYDQKKCVRIVSYVNSKHTWYRHFLPVTIGVVAQAMHWTYYIVWLRLWHIDKAIFPIIIE